MDRLPALWRQKRGLSTQDLSASAPSATFCWLIPREMLTGILLLSAEGAAAKAVGHDKERTLRTSEKQERKLGLFTLKESKDGKEYKVKSERWYHGEGTGVAIPALKSLRDLEQIHRGDWSQPGVAPGVAAWLGQAEEGATGRLFHPPSLDFQPHRHAWLLLGIVLVYGLEVFQLVSFFKAAAEKAVGLIHEFEDNICFWRRNLLLLKTTKPTLSYVLMGCTIFNSSN